MKPVINKHLKEMVKMEEFSPPKPVPPFPFPIKKASLSGGSFMMKIFPGFNLFR
jgi:hypothetical protein